MFKFRIINTLLLVLCLTGCSRFQSTEILTDPQSLREKAIVVTNISRPAMNMFDDMQSFMQKSNTPTYRVHTKWARVDDQYFTGKPLIYTFDSHSAFFEIPQTGIFMVEPGTYVLETFIYNLGGLMIESPGRGYSKEYGPRFTMFTVKKGQKAYIGHLSIDHRSNTVVSVEDHFAQAQEVFKKAYPAISGPLENKTIKLSIVNF